MLKSASLTDLQKSIILNQATEVPFEESAADCALPSLAADARVLPHPPPLLADDRRATEGPRVPSKADEVVAHRALLGHPVLVVVRRGVPLVPLRLPGGIPECHLMLVLVHG